MAYIKQNFKDGQTLKAEHLNHMEDGLSKISYNDLKDKPFYTEENGCTLLPETTVEFDPESGEGFSMTKLNLVKGNTYTVEWHDVEYSCVAQNWIVDYTTDEGETVPTFAGVVVGDVGSLDTGNPVTGEPFIILDINETLAAEYGVPTILTALDGSESATLSIRGEVVHKLDEKYLPDGYPYAESVIVDILPETTVEIDPESGAGTITTEFKLVAGNTYTVMWNGVEYTRVAQTWIDEEGVFMGVAVGDLGAAMTGEPVTGEPFVVFAFSDMLAADAGASGGIAPLDGSESVTVSIRGEGEMVHKLDEKYLPDCVLYTEHNVCILPETTAEIDPDSDSANISNVLDVTIGNTYTVKWNGTEYTCVAQAFEMSGAPAVVLGNIGSIWGESTGEPFVVLCLDAETATESGAGCMIVALDDSKSVALSISGDIYHNHNVEVWTFTLKDGSTVTKKVAISV